MKEPKLYNVKSSAKRSVKIITLDFGDKTAYRYKTVVKKLPVRKISY